MESVDIAVKMGTRQLYYITEHIGPPPPTPPLVKEKLSQANPSKSSINETAKIISGVEWQ